MEKNNQNSIDIKDNLKISQQKISHMHGVAEYMYLNADKYRLNKEEMYILGLLHDIGYLNGKKHHPLYGGQILNNCGYSHSIYIYWHGSTPDEYKRAHSCSDKEIPKQLVLLWEADLSIGITGENIGYEKRLEDIGNRYGLDSKAYRIAKETIDWLLNQNK